MEDKTLGSGVDEARCDTRWELEGREGCRVRGVGQGVLVCICHGVVEGVGTYQVTWMSLMGEGEGVDRDGE